MSEAQLHPQRVGSTCLLAAVLALSMSASLPAEDALARAQSLGGAPVLRGEALLEVELVGDEGAGPAARIEVGVAGGACYVAGIRGDQQRWRIAVGAGATGRLDEVRVLGPTGALIATGRLALGTQPAGTLRVLALGRMPELSEGARLGARLGERFSLIAPDAPGDALEVADVVVLGAALGVEAGGGWHEQLAARVRGGCTLVVASERAERELLAALAGRPGAALELAGRLQGATAIRGVGAGKVVRWHLLSGTPEEAAAAVGSLAPRHGSTWRPRGLSREQSGARALLSARWLPAVGLWLVATASMLALARWPRRSRIPPPIRVACAAAACLGLAFVPVGGDMLARACPVEARRVIVVDATRGEDWAVVEERVVVRARDDHVQVRATSLAMQDLLDWESGSSDLEQQTTLATLGRDVPGWLQGGGASRILARPLLIELAGDEVLIGNQLEVVIGPVLVLEGGGRPPRVVEAIPPGALETAHSDRASAQTAREQLSAWVRTSAQGLGEGELLVIAALSPRTASGPGDLVGAARLLERAPGVVAGARPDEGRLFWRELVHRAAAR